MSGSEDENQHPGSSFRYILDFTLYRPRDLILFFQPLQSGNFTIPLKPSDIYNLAGQYVENFVLEIKNELSSFYDSIQIETILNALREISKENDCSYDKAAQIVKENTCNIPIDEILNDLFNRSIIGNKKSNGHMVFKCREPLNSAEVYKLRQEYSIVIQNGFKLYLSNRYT